MEKRKMETYNSGNWNNYSAPTKMQIENVYDQRNWYFKDIIPKPPKTKPPDHPRNTSGAVVRSAVILQRTKMTFPAILWD